ncbi:unnamed protein product [Rhizophagus irregularis]|uniref:Bromo domain-containing protein n=1 Tax=Rhizophagus irregularis TaxID=588596 RepID=A0A916E6T1_9GLOM|nr:unnamed protein product [Rhizophagus irregularis]CAB5364202.1 unnamed protein product [Rhizophagus irregularis]
MNTTEDYIGHEALVSYLNEPGNKSYRRFLNLNQDIIIASLTQLTHSSLTLTKWQIFDITWHKRFLCKAKELLEPNRFIAVKKKVNTEYSQRKKDLQIFWQEVIKEYEKENTYTTTVESLPKNDDLSETLQPGVLQPNQIDNTENLSETSQSDALLPIEIVKSSAETLQPELPKKNTKIIDFCCEILYELENKSYTHLFYKYSEKNIKNKVIIKYPMDLFTINLKLKNNQYTSLEEFEKDIRLIFRNCYKYNDIGSEIYCSGEALESDFNKIWNEKLILQKKQTRELKRVRDNDTDADSSFTRFSKKQSHLEQNEDNLMYKQVVNDALTIASAYESLVTGDIIPFIEILKNFLLTRSRMSLTLADESMLQAIVESLLPLKYRIPELSLVMDGKKSKGSGRFGYSDIFILKGLGDYNISLELKYISLVGLIRNQKIKFGANELDNLDKILENEDEEDLLKRSYIYWSKEFKTTNQTTIGEVLNSGINQLKSYMNIISEGKVADYSSSGIFDERVEIIKSNPNKIKGFVIIVIGFRRILWKPVEEVTSNYIYNKV